MPGKQFLAIGKKQGGPDPTNFVVAIVHGRVLVGENLSDVAAYANGVQVSIDDDHPDLIGLES